MAHGFDSRPDRSLYTLFVYSGPAAAATLGFVAAAAFARDADAKAALGSDVRSEIRSEMADLQLTRLEPSGDFVLRTPRIESSDAPESSPAGAKAGGQAGWPAGRAPSGFKPAPVLGALKETPPPPLKRLKRFDGSRVALSASGESPAIFDIPIAYNDRVKRWIEYFQSTGRTSFKKWLERSARYLPLISYELEAAGMPQDLAYVAMIESGFRPEATSPASAVGLWQFMARTAAHYGLRVSWWLDERRDFHKSTKAAIGYMGDLYKMFGSWYLVAASYNMGEFAVARLMKRHRTNDFWRLADVGALPEETTNYVPKILAATLISKAPALYGFRELSYSVPDAFDWFLAPGGTDLSDLAQYLGVSPRYMLDLNPELTRGFIPREARGHRIRVPRGATLAAANFARVQAGAISLRN